MITQVHQESNDTYGASRVHAELSMGRGITVGHNGVAMLMHRAGTASAKWRGEEASTQG